MRGILLQPPLLHCLIIPLLDLIQSSNNGIIVTLVAKCPLHVHQQVPHRDVLTLVQGAGPFAWVPTETGEDVGAHTSLIILLKKGINIEAPECVRHLRPWIGRLEDRHIQSHGHQPFPLPTSSAPMLMTCSLTRGGVSVSVWRSPVWGGRGQPPSANHSALGLRWPSTQSHCPSTAGESCLSLFPHPTSWLEESDSRAAPTGAFWGGGFSAQLLSLWRSEAVMDCHHTSIKGRRLILKWAEREIHSKKASSVWDWTTSTASCSKPR